MKGYWIVKYIVQSLSIFLIVSCASNSNKLNVSLMSDSEVKEKADASGKIQPMNMDSQIHIITDWESPVVFLGYVDTQADANSNGGMVYSADAGAAGLLVQILAHAAISNSVQKKKAKEKQDEANEALTPYLELIDKITNKSLIDSLAASNIGQRFNIVNTKQESSVPVGDVVAVLSPEFFIPSDQRSIMMKMNLNAYQVTPKDKLIHGQSIKVISDQVDDDLDQNQWLESLPSHFETTIYDLFSEGLDLLLSDLLSVVSTDRSPKKTYSYKFDGRKRFERAELIKQDCDRLILKNLKNNFVVIPYSSNCEENIEVSSSDGELSEDKI